RACAAGRELGAAGEKSVVPAEQLLAERVAELLIVVEAAVEALDMGGRDEVEEILVEIGADELAAALREARIVELLEKRGEAGWNDRIENDLRSASRDPLDRLTVLHVIDGMVLLPDDLAAVGGDDLADFPVHDVRPDVVGRGQVERL